MFACGGLHTLFLNSDGTVWVCEKNDKGQLGLGDLLSRKDFVKVESLPPIVQITTTKGHEKSHSYFLDSDGNVWVCGVNTHGQLGIENTLKQIVSPPQIVPNLPFIEMVSCGIHHTLLLDNTGSVWAGGNNSHGQLGTVIVGNYTAFVNIDTTHVGKIKKIVCGSDHSIAQNEAGELWGCGSNKDGQIGFRFDVNKIQTFTRINVGIEVDQIEDVYCGADHTLILDKQGRVWGTGYNGNGQLGLGDTLSRDEFTVMISNTPVRGIICGGYHTIVIDHNGQILGCGSNTTKALGLGTTLFSNFTTLQVIPNVPKILSGDAGRTHTFLLDELGEVWGCGSNQWGKLGVKAKTKSTFIKVPGLVAICGGMKRFCNTKRARTNVADEEDAPQSKQMKTE